MWVTARYAVSVLRRSGRPVTDRALRDWVAKGLLPARHRVGRGQGRGVDWVWCEPDIIRWAAAVHDLLRWHGRVRSTWLPLWALGFDVPVAEVRAQFLAFLDGWLTAVTGDVVDPDDVRDNISRFVVRAARARRSP